MEDGTSQVLAIVYVLKDFIPQKMIFLKGPELQEGRAMIWVKSTARLSCHDNTLIPLPLTINDW